MGIKLVEDRLGLVNKLLSRKLNFDEEDVKDYLKKIIILMLLMD
ncbi:hypothetical protein ACS7ZM_001798 [Enterococcus faecalis]